MTATVLGWDRRTAVLLAASALGVVAPVAAVLLGVCAVLFVGESATSWRHGPAAEAGP